MDYIKQASDERIGMAEDSSSVIINLGDYSILVEAVCVVVDDPDPNSASEKILKPHMLISRVV